MLLHGLQRHVAEADQDFERLCAQQRDTARQVKHLFQTLLHKAFRGELTEAEAVGV
jgi:type I restriction enzyme, S subunit